MTTQPLHRQPPDAALLSIGFMMEKMERLLWRSGGGRGAWESCLAALVLAFEPNCKPLRLLESLPAENGMDEVDVLNTMAHLGYFSNAERIALDDADTRLLPCLFVTEAGPRVILSRQDDGFVVYDGASHKIDIVPPGSKAARMHGDARFFQPFDRHRTDTSKFMREGTGQSWFAAVAHRFSPTLWMVLLICLIINAVALAPSLFVMVVYDRVISPADLSGLPYIAGGVLLALYAEHRLREVRAEALSWITGRLDNLIGGRIFAHLIGLPPELIEQASVAAQVARIKTFETVRDFFSSAVFLSFLEVPFVVIALGLMAAIAGPLAFVPLAMIGGYAAIFVLVRGRIKRAIRLAAKASSARQQFTIETFEKLDSVRMNGLTDVWSRKFDDMAGREILMNFHLGFLGTVAETLAHALTVLSAVLVVGFGAHLVWTQGLTTGELVASMILVWRILLPFYSLCTMIPRLEQLRNSVLQVNSLMDLETETDAAPMAVLPTVRGRIAMESVTFGYDSDKDPVIEGLSLTVPAGALAVLTGRSGAGKTSTLKLLKGLYRPQGGAVRLDGFDIRQLDACALRRQIAYLPQRAEFFPGTVAENLLIGNPLAARAEVEDALKRADAFDDVQRLGGLEAEIGRSAFSPHLAARLALARLYLIDAPVVLLDELPNAVLNGPAGMRLREYLVSCRGRKTVVMVCQRRDFMDMADIVVQLTRGHVPVVGAPAKEKETA